MEDLVPFVEDAVIKRTVLGLEEPDRFFVVAAVAVVPLSMAIPMFASRLAGPKVTHFRVF